MSDDILLLPVGKGSADSLEPRDVPEEQASLGTYAVRGRSRLVPVMPARRFWNSAWKSSSGVSSWRERGIAPELDRGRLTAQTETF
jgi:hypothetical protein